MNKLLLSAVLPVLSAVLLTSCSEKQQSSSSADEATPSSSRSSAEESSKKLFISSSSANTPLEKEAWGGAAKFCTANNSYVNVPVRILSFERGKQTGREVERLASQSSFSGYVPPGSSEEYVLVEYELSLSGFPIEEGGTLNTISAHITDSDGNMLKLSDGSYWGASAVCLDEDKYYYEGIVKGRLAYRIPEKCHDYLLVLGEEGQTQAFFKGV